MGILFKYICLQVDLCKVTEKWDKKKNPEAINSLNKKIKVSFFCPVYSNKLNHGLKLFEERIVSRIF